MVRLLENMEKPSQLWMHIWVLNFNNYTWIFNLLETHGETISTADGKRENQNISLKPLTSHHTMQLSTAWRWWPNGPGWTVQTLTFRTYDCHGITEIFVCEPSLTPLVLSLLEGLRHGQGRWSKLKKQNYHPMYLRLYICIYIYVQL